MKMSTPRVRRFTLISPFLGALLLIPAGCAKKVETKTAASVDMTSTWSSPDEEPVADAASAFDPSEAPKIIFFEFDSTRLSEEALARLDTLGDLLMENPEVNVTIFGHTDERGNDEYNLSLGDSRAHAAQRYLSSLGVSKERIKVVSYGEEMPMEEGAGADVWSKNRRDEFALK